MESIEIFEQDIMKCFIANGWNTEKENWFVINIESLYKNKIATVVRIETGQIFKSSCETYDKCFESIIDKLKIEKLKGA